MADREAKHVKLVKSKSVGGSFSNNDLIEQHWEITDHKGKVHKHVTRAGYGDEPTGRTLNKKYTVKGEPTTARELLGYAISTGEVAQDGDKARIDSDEHGFAFR